MMKYEYLNIDITKIQRFDVDLFWEDNKALIQMIADRAQESTGQVIDQYLIRSSVWQVVKTIKTIHFGAKWVKE